MTRCFKELVSYMIYARSYSDICHILFFIYLIISVIFSDVNSALNIFINHVHRCIFWLRVLIRFWVLMLLIFFFFFTSNWHSLSKCHFLSLFFVWTSVEKNPMLLRIIWFEISELYYVNVQNSICFTTDDIFSFLKVCLLICKFHFNVIDKWLIPGFKAFKFISLSNYMNEHMKLCKYYNPWLFNDRTFPLFTKFVHCKLWGRLFNIHHSSSLQ